MVRLTDNLAMTIAVGLGRKAIKQSKLIKLSQKRSDIVLNYLLLGPIQAYLSLLLISAFSLKLISHGYLIVI